MLPKELLTKCKQKRKESYLKEDLHSYIKYSSIIMPEELGINVKKCAEFFGYSPSSIYRLRADLLSKNQEKIASWGGRRNGLLTPEDELNFINSFKNEIKQGKSLNFKEIKARIENKIGKSMHKTSIYRLLDRHGCKNIITKTPNKS